MTAVLLLAVAGPSAAASAPRGSAEDPAAELLAERVLPTVDYISVERGYVIRSENVRYGDAPAAYASYEGGGENGFARGVLRVGWQTGDNVVYGASFLLPPGFHDSLQGQVDLLRWDNWPTNGTAADWGGIAVYGGDKRARLLRYTASEARSDTIGQPFRLPEGRWFTLEVRQQLGPDRALSSVHTDGRLRTTGLEPTSYGRPIERVRAGLVAIASGVQETPLELFMAEPYARKLPDAVSEPGAADSGRTVGGFLRDLLRAVLALLS